MLAQQRVQLGPVRLAQNDDPRVVLVVVLAVEPSAPDLPAEPSGDRGGVVPLPEVRDQLHRRHRTLCP